MQFLLTWIRCHKDSYFINQFQVSTSFILVNHVPLALTVFCTLVPNSCTFFCGRVKLAKLSTQGVPCGNWKLPINKPISKYGYSNLKISWCMLHHRYHVQVLFLFMPAMSENNKQSWTAKCVYEPPLFLVPLLWFPLSPKANQTSHGAHEYVV